ncbi:hypothetical protein L1987_24857 [Smallanthus sonchifolius]|uniref:Uncharacterized protein n=1 Tax=Smallanthus sonchifolius TaxID=185202 RepID=A0ACB9ILT0_9ASTR|nr:hypothetical protein L1987_24857 [Smallanthus sonchifolius]
MDVDPPLPPSSASKKVSKSAKKVSPPLLPKFTPKPPVKRKSAPILPKSDSSDADSESDQELLRVVMERLRSGVPKVEKKSSDNATASHGAGSSRTHDPPKKDGDSKSSLNLRETSGRSVKLSSSTATKNEDTDHMLVDDEFGSSSNSENEYKEPWDPYSYYPISLPLRPPGSGDPEILNAEEFGKQDVYDETKINSALELGLSGSVDNEDKHIILFQFPEKLPLDQVPVGSSSSLKEDASNKSFGLKDLPNGCIGKMLVYKSGAIKLKLGDTIFDVSSGTPCASDRSAAMMNTKSEDCFVLGKVNKRAIVTPDLNSILDNINLLQHS